MTAIRLTAAGDSWQARDAANEALIALLERELDSFRAEYRRTEARIYGGLPELTRSHP